MGFTKTGVVENSVKKIDENQQEEQLTQFASQSHAEEERLKEASRQTKPKTEFNEDTLLGK